MWAFGFYNLANLGLYSAPPVRAAAKALARAIDLAVDEGDRMAESTRRMEALGFPPPFFVGAPVEAPFDFMSDTLRGMRGIMLDMLREPEKLLAAEEVVLETMLEFVLHSAKVTGVRWADFPLHRGSDGFMSLSQFERFYWPQLKRMLVTLIENDITPYVFFEGVWDSRLEYLAELPKGKIVGMFQKSDIFKVKEIVGDTMCIGGGMPNSLLTGGTVSEVRERTHELCERVGKNGGYIMATAVGELEGSKPHLLRAWVDATREFGVY
jgi:uroporphyrinogen-III decarboxylase